MELLERVKLLSALFEEDFTCLVSQNDSVDKIESAQNYSNTITIALTNFYFGALKDINNYVEESLKLAVKKILSMGYKVVISSSNTNKLYCEKIIMQLKSDSITYADEKEALDLISKSFLSINFGQTYDVLCMVLGKPYISITRNEHDIQVLTELNLDSLIISYDNYDSGKILRKIEYVKNNYKLIQGIINKIFNDEKSISDELEQYKQQTKNHIINLIKCNQYEEARFLIEKYESVINDDIEIISISAVIAFNEGKLDDAESLLKRGLSINEKDFDLLYNLACVYEQKQMFEEALAYYNKSREFSNEEMKAEINTIIENMTIYSEDKSANNLESLHRKKVLVIAYIFPPLGGSGVQRTLKFVKYLRNYGWEPIVICAGKSSNQPMDESLLNEIPNDIEIKRIDDISNITLNDENVNEIFNLYNDMIDDKEIVQEYVEELQKNNNDINRFAELLFIPGYSVIWTKLVMDKIDELVNIDDIDMIYTTSGPYTDHFVGYYLKKKYNKPWVADFRDEWSNRSYSEEQKNTINYKLAHSIETSIVHLADKVVTTSPMSSENYIKIYQLDQSKVETITNGFDEDDFKDICIENKYNEEFTIIYNGVLYGSETISAFLTAVKNLILKKLINSGKLKIKFTRTEHIDVIIEKAKVLGIINNIEILGYLEHKESLKECNQADLLLVVIEPNEKNKPAYPGKIFEYIRLNKPVLSISPNGSAVEKLVCELKMGLSCEDTDIEGIEKGVLQIYRAWEKGEQFNKLTNTKIEKYERKKLTEDLSNTFEDIIKSRIEHEHNIKLMESDIYRIVEESRDDQPTTVMNFINYIEENLPVKNWVVDGIHIWPLIRIPFGFIANQALCEIPKNKVDEDSRVCKVDRPNLANDDSMAYKNADVIFLIRTNQSRILLNDKWYDRFCDPLLEVCNENNISTLALEYCDKEKYREPTFNPTIKIQNYIDEFIKENTNIRCINYSLDEFNDLIYLISVFHKLTGYKTRNFSVEQLIYSVKLIRIYAEYFKKCFNKVKPKVGFMVCYYNSLYEYAFSLACREYGIPSVDIQHGRNGELHISYGRWNSVPKTGYELMPSIFWCWDNVAVNAIKEWNKNCLKWHDAIKCGNPWISKCLENDFELLHDENKKIEKIISKDMNILYTHTHPGEIPQLLLETIDRCPREWHWWIRFHPLAKKEVVERDSNLLDLCQNKNIEYKLASTIPLNSWFKYIDVHVTENSSSVVEASDFGVATVLIGSEKTCKKMYNKEIEDGYAIMARDCINLIRSIEKQCLKTEEMKKVTVGNKMKKSKENKVILEHIMNMHQY